jgi:hypothetical protein
MLITVFFQTDRHAEFNTCSWALRTICLYVEIRIRKYEY